MMKPVRPSALAGALPVGPGHRLPLTLLNLTVRDHFLRLAGEIHCAGLSDRQAAEFLHKRLSRYREFSWQRDRIAAECPRRLYGRVEGLLWAALKCSDRLVGVELIRKVLADR
jgi:hypothetical protein